MPPATERATEFPTGRQGRGGGGGREGGNSRHAGEQDTGKVERVVTVVTSSGRFSIYAGNPRRTSDRSTPAVSFKRKI